MKKTHLVTGGTGFIGSSLILELLSQTDANIEVAQNRVDFEENRNHSDVRNEKNEEALHNSQPNFEQLPNIVCIVRPKKETAEQRLYSVLEQVAKAYEYPDTVIELAKDRCKVVEGDLSMDGSVLKEKIKHSSINQFWHVAASLNYESRFAEEIFSTNVEGTKQVLKLARVLDVDYFNYFSTAYVAGKQSGLILEEEVHEVETNNIYEKSKIEAENLIYPIQDMKTRIFRPSVVIGHNETYEAINFSGLYGFLRRLVQFRGMMERVQAGYLSNERIRMRVDAHSPLNLIPVDAVTKQAVCIGNSTSLAPIFHLTNPQVPTMAEVLDTMFSSADIEKPLLVETTNEFNWIDEKFSEKMDFYNSYLRGNKIFDRSNTDAALQNVARDEYAINSDRLRLFCDWYVRLLIAKRRQMPVSR